MNSMLTRSLFAALCALLVAAPANATSAVSAIAVSSLAVSALPAAASDSSYVSAHDLEQIAALLQTLESSSALDLYSPQTSAETTAEDDVEALRTLSATAFDEQLSSAVPPLSSLSTAPRYDGSHRWAKYCLGAHEAALRCGIRTNRFLE